MTLYREFTTPEQIDREYNAVLSVPELRPYLEADAVANEAARRDLERIPDVPYGTGPDENMDIYPGGSPNSPVLVFIHGGYWVSMHSRDFAFVARGLTACGITVALPNYSLCPSVSLPEITAQNRAAVAWAHRNIRRFGGDPDNLYVCGHSAGAQQAGMLLATDWEAHGLPGEAVRGGVAVSGIYDLAPLRHSWLQPRLRLTDGIAADQSPLFRIPQAGPPLLVVVGENETAEFRRQAGEYSAAWRHGGNQAELIVLEERNHFTVLRDLNLAEGRLTRLLRRFMDHCRNDVPA